ncbi:scp-like extracellular protein [Diaporthe eres]|uniref:LysM domain-containing protein n=1 Tax=Diaporthe vaccinii TaxID=105482 RepID=A0ABR4FDP3_9PEZI|nr:scp-like extracellular protein [Diaporthe eres]
MSDSQSALDAHNYGDYLPADLVSPKRDANHLPARRSAPGQQRPDLTWDDGLANDAKQYAQHLADTKKFEHSGVNGQGENLFMSSGDASLTDATHAWLNEKPNYHGENIPDGDFGSYGHYTQCIWPTTTKVGIASAKASDGATYIVGRYTPPGNWMGQNAYGTDNKVASAAATDAAPAESSEYTVVDGDSMWNISQKLDVSLDDPKARNPQIEGPDFVVRKGDVLTIPCKSSQKQFGVKVLSAIESSGGGYVVVPGDSLWAIAQKLGVDLAALQAANPDVRGPDYQVNVGQTLNVPGQGGGAQTYTVVAGDTMYNIAERSGVSLQDLQSANPQVQGPEYALHEGDVLTIPGGGHAPAGPPASGGAGGIVHYSGPSSNFPGPDKWVSWETMSAHNAQVMNTTGNSGQETQWVLDAVVTVSGELNIDRRCILAVIMQESHGKVRVNNTTSPGAGVNNTGIMQAHNGASFNEGDPQGSILRMVRDGAGGVPGPTGGDGYRQLLDRYGNDFYVAARGYNSGDLGINF